MKWAYDLCGAEPIIKDEPVYDAAALAYGELLMLGASAFTAGADAGFALVTAVPTTVMANMAVDAVGICLEDKSTSSSTSVATAHNVTTGGGCYAKVIINPFAIYRAGVTDGLAVASSASTNEVCITGVPASAFDGSWVYFNASAGPNYGTLRKVVTSATAGTQDLDLAATATITTADTVLIIAEKNKYPHDLAADALTVSTTTVGGFGVTNIRVVENYIDRGAGMEILRYGTHRQVELGTGLYVPKFYQDLMMKDHAFGVQE
jgi:hypothetical protein